MTEPERRLQPNAAEVAAKVIDGEAIIMNLSNGTYYSMDGVGAVIWELLAAGHPVGAVADALVRRYDTGPAEAGDDLARLAEELEQEGLMLPLSGTGTPFPIDSPPSETLEPYHTPVLNKYTDMADLLALDPPMPAIGEVHDS